ncbi:DgyrCDS6589 [Dimorphilus gyrociliatus]|uniref:DgyrCDS6589 n=1 Tax=Dimorphilus gyrociliatus TaxID=2664684 RepID=A0A7I8VR81_9ANNE|nr:DgyrCDS6589 [Dimorphilus gyrociliatus]
MAGEISQDMHLKMSKKIAQLTKVIYALNTKNDEHEAIMATTKEQYEEEVQKILEDTKLKIESYKDIMKEDTNQRKLIENLEKRISQHEKEKVDAQETFQKYKEIMAEKISEMKTSHSEKLISLSNEVLNIKKDFESQLEKLLEAKREIEEEKEKMIDELKKSYEIKAEELKLGLSSKEKNNEIYQNQVETLESECKQLRLDKDKLREEFENRLREERASHEKELESLNTSQNSAHEEHMKRLQEDYDKLLKVHEDMNVDNLQKIQELLTKQSEVEAEADNFKRMLEELQNSMKGMNSTTASLSQQLSTTQEELSNSISINKQLEGEIKAINDRCEKQSTELIDKSSTIGKLEAVKIQVDSQLKESLGELNKVKDKLKWLEDERKSMEEKGQSQMTEQSKQLKSLEKSLESLSAEKQELQQKYDRDMESLKQSSDEREKTSDKKWKTKLEEMEAKFTKEIEEHRRLAEESYAKLKNDLEGQLGNEKENLMDCNKRIEELSKEKEDYQNTLQNARLEIEGLQKSLQERDANLGGATSDLEGLKNKCKSLEEELEESHDQLRNLKTQFNSIKNELENSKKTNEKLIKDNEERLRKELDKLSKDLDEKWMLRLRTETEKVLTEQEKKSSEDKKSAIDELLKLHGEELSSERSSWDERVQNLLKEIASLKSALDSKSIENQEIINRIKREAEEENNILRKDMLAAANEFKDNIDELDKKHASEILVLEQRNDEKLKEFEINLKKKHVDDMKAQLTAHNSTVEMIKENCEKDKQKSLEDLRKKNLEKIAIIRSDLEQAHALDMEQRERQHDQQMAAARLELDRSLEVIQQKDSEYAIKLSELESDANSKLTLINELEKEVSILQTGVQEMSKELEAKGQEVLRVRSEMIKSSKAKEDKLKNEYELSILNLKNDHHKEIDGMLEDFNKAQELLKDKINTLTILLEEAEEKYENRESREEDLLEIKRLQQSVVDREDAIKKLIDDKKYYQLELVNRETNFNKVFSSSPNVGVINPLVKQKNSGKSDSSRKQSKLDPLPNSSIIHSDNLNGKVPLPNPKKFVK